MLPDFGVRSMVFLGVCYSCPAPEAACGPPRSLPPASPIAGEVDMGAASDSGAATGSNVPKRVLGRQFCQSHCIWFLGKQSNSLLSTLPGETWETGYPYV